MTAVHHLHIWSLGAGEIAMTAHLVRPDDDDHDAFIDRVSHALDERFGINHPTLQVEHGDACDHDRHDRAPHGTEQPRPRGGLAPIIPRPDCRQHRSRRCSTTSRTTPRPAWPRASRPCATTCVKVRTGRASTALVDHIKVNYYGSDMPLIAGRQRGGRPTPAR